MDAQTITIEGTTHEWLNNSECDYHKCRRNTEEVTWCDDCDVAFCKHHVEYYNNYKMGTTHCPDCHSLNRLYL